MQMEDKFLSLLSGFSMKKKSEDKEITARKTCANYMEETILKTKQNPPTNNNCVFKKTYILKVVSYKTRNSKELASRVLPGSSRNTLLPGFVPISSLRHSPNIQKGKKVHFCILEEH